MDKYKNKAIASMVLGIISLVFLWFGYSSLVSIVCGVIALVFGIQIRKAGEAEGFTPNGMAKAGFILGIIGIVLSSLWLASCISCAAWGNNNLTNYYRYYNYYDLPDILREFRSFSF